MKRCGWAGISDRAVKSGKEEAAGSCGWFYTAGLDQSWFLPGLASLLVPARCVAGACSMCMHEHRKDRNRHGGCLSQKEPPGGGNDP